MRSWSHLFIAVFLLGFFAPFEASAQTLVPFPEIPRAIGDPDFHGDTPIRDTHMLLLLHQRDETMRQGLRPEKESLKGCLSCHAVKDDVGQAISYENPGHFCRVCHDYAAVQVDCFSCHSSLPDPSKLMEVVAEGSEQ